MNNMPSFVQLASGSFKCFFFFFHLSLQIRFPLKCHCKEIYHFMNAHTLQSCLIDIMSMYKHDLFVPIYILRKRKCIHTPDNAHLFKYPCVSRIFIFFSIDEIKIFFIIIIYDLTAAAYMCQESNLAFVKIMACRLIGVIFYINADLKWSRHEPDWFCGVFSNINFRWPTATRFNENFVFFCRFRVGLVAVTGV